MVESHKIHVPNHQPAMASPKSSILIGFSIANYPETIDNHMPICSMYSIFTYMWLNYRVNVGKYSSTMEHMGYIVIGLLFTNFQRFRGHAGPTGAPTGAPLDSHLPTRLPCAPSLARLAAVSAASCAAMRSPVTTSAVF